MKKLLAIFTFSSVLISCTSTPNQIEQKKDNSAEQNVYADMPAEFEAMLEAHGGLEKWKQYAALSFDLIAKDSTVQHHIVDLNSRKVRIEADSFLLGFDGKEVWVSPNLAAFDGKSARFYHNLFFYFFGIPFLLADPGVHYETENVTLDGRTYQGIRTTFDNGVGDASGDIYIVLVDPENGQLFGLLYTVTYFSGEVHENFNFLKYSDWMRVEGLLLPGQLIGYAIENDSLKNVRYETRFENVRLDRITPDASLFEKPAGAEVDSLLRKQAQ